MNVTRSVDKEFFLFLPFSFFRTISSELWFTVIFIIQIHVTSLHIITIAWFLSERMSHATPTLPVTPIQLSETFDYIIPLLHSINIYPPIKKKNLPTFETFSRELKFKTNLPSTFPSLHLVRNKKERKNNKSILIIHFRKGVKTPSSFSPSKRKEGKRREEEFGQDRCAEAVKNVPRGVEEEVERRKMERGECWIGEVRSKRCGIEGRGARCFGKLFLIAVPMRVRAEGDRAGPRSRVFLGGARHAAHHRNVFDTTRNKVFIELASRECVHADRNQQRPWPAKVDRFTVSCRETMRN